jgi:hypothetical protein
LARAPDARARSAAARAATLAPPLMIAEQGHFRVGAEPVEAEQGTIMA